MNTELHYKTTNGKYTTRQYNLSDPVDIIRYIARKRFVWPGGYELCAIMNDGGLVCSDCVKENYYDILNSTKGDYQDGWQVMAIENESMIEDDFCSHCNKELGYHD